MMTKSIRQSGAVLSSLLYECANSPIDLEGFLMGSLATRTLGAIDDMSDRSNDTIEHFTVVQGYSISRVRFYNSQGQIDVNAIRQQIGPMNSLEEVVGYFRFRRDTALSLSVREQILIQGLEAVVPNLSCMALITATLVEENDSSTHAHDIAFYDLEKSRIPLQIMNMTETTLAYQQFVPSTAIHHSSPLDCQLSTMVDPKGIMSQYDAMYYRAMHELERATRQVIEKEQELKTLMAQRQRSMST
ncbi:hypothetical protein BX666DRAFT_188246 [Dichotomocladium elegans]|nr:hypothetical protein BX666DRAFT_188246 [Dichotomocladium elegans]